MLRDYARGARDRRGGARRARSDARDRRRSVVGVIGTAGTIASGAYERAIHAIEPRAHGRSRARARSSCRSWKRAGRIATRRASSRANISSRSPRRRWTRSCWDARIIRCSRRSSASSRGRACSLIDSAAETAAETRRTLDRARSRRAASDGNAGASLRRVRRCRPLSTRRPALPRARRSIASRRSPSDDPLHARSSMRSGRMTRYAGASIHAPGFAYTPPPGARSSVATCE